MMGLIDRKPSPKEQQADKERQEAARREEARREAARAAAEPHRAAIEAIGRLSLDEFCDLAEVVVADLAERGMTPQEAARLTKASNEIGGLAWPFLEPG